MRPNTSDSSSSKSNFIFQGVFWLMLAIAVSGCDTFSIGSFGLAHTPATNEQTDANPESYAMIGQHQLDVSTDNGVLANDTGAGAVTAVSMTTANGGRLELREDGSFTYFAADGFFGTDRFDYTLEMNGETATGTASIKVYPADAIPVP